jgi:hypothetical protein
MKPFAFFALLLCSANVLAQTPAAQIAKLQNDPNIIWIGEFYRDYEDLDNGYEGRNIDRHAPDTLRDGSILHTHRQNTGILKIERRSAARGEWLHYFWAQIIDPKIKIFADADLSKPISDADRKKYLTTTDTIVILNPETFAETLTPVINNLSPNSIYAYRMRQLVYYNAKENMYYNLPLSIAPIVIIRDDNGNGLGTVPLFWFPIIASSTPINPSKAPNMPFIKSVQMHLPFADAKVLKESKKSEEVNQIWLKQIGQQKDKIFATTVGADTDDENNEQLSGRDIQGTYIAIDTVAYIDPATSKETLTVLTSEPATIVDLRINQTFGWDDKKKTLTVATYSIAPVVNRYDDGGNLLHTGPLFYLYPHRRFKTVPK